MIRSKTMKRKRHGEGEDQVECWTTDAGHVWIHYYDHMPPRVRARLRTSSFNLCPACLETRFLCEVQSQHPGYSREKALLAGIEMMEVELHKHRRTK
jgi:hypothetical protein